MKKRLALSNKCTEVYFKKFWSIFSFIQKWFYSFKSGWEVNNPKCDIKAEIMTIYSLLHYIKGTN